MRELKPCGTFAAYQRHRRHGEVPCEECWDAARARTRNYYRDHYGVFAKNRKALPPMAEHGTAAAYCQHHRRGEKACQECRAAMTAYQRLRKQARREVTA